MNYSLDQESFDTITGYWSDKSLGLQWDAPFNLPAWMKVWWQTFKPQTSLNIKSVKEDGRIIGIAPLMTSGDTAQLIGSANVCDYLDFVIVPGKEEVFFKALLEDLKKSGIKNLDLHPLRPDSTVLSHLVKIVKTMGGEVKTEPEDVSVELDLPATFEDYLDLLDKKQRHEVRRKIRRLEEAGKINYRSAGSAAEVDGLLDTFLKLFTISRDDKAAFLTPEMEVYFRALTRAMAEIGILKFGVLELDAKTMAMVLAFDYNNVMYLYNSGYDPNYAGLSVGLICKVLCLKQSIEEGKKRYNFLKGSEVYKYRIGGKEVPIYNCQMSIG